MAQIEPKIENDNKAKYTFNNLPMLCLVEILSFLETDINCLNYRIISKKYNEAVLLKLFEKLEKSDIEFYKKCFIILNPNVHKYFSNNIYPFLINADSLYEFFNDYNEETFNKFYNYSLNEFKKITEIQNLNKKEKNIEKSFKNYVKKFIVTMAIGNFKNKKYESLYFNKLNPYDDAFDMIILLIKLMKEIIYLNISNILINDEIFLAKLIDKIALRDKFTLILDGVFISIDLLKIIKTIMNKNINIKVVIDKKYNKEMNTLGGKKLNKDKNLNKKIFKYIQFKK